MCKRDGVRVTVHLCSHLAGQVFSSEHLEKRDGRGKGSTGRTPESYHVRPADYQGS